MHSQVLTCRVVLPQVLIQNGELVTGTLCKKTLGASQGSLIHIIWNEEGPEAARAFLSQTQFCVNYWLLQHGMSIGIGDTVANADTMMKITNIIAGVRCLPCHRSLASQVLASCRVPAARRSYSRLVAPSHRAPGRHLNCHRSGFV